MDGFNEKKWFVYLGDHHEGPFSLAEIQEKMGQSQVTSANYVWCEGMGDWKAMTEVPEFESILGAREDHTVMAVSAPKAAGAEEVAPEPAPTPAPEPVYNPPKDEKTGDMDPKEVAKVRAQSLGGTAPGSMSVRGGERFVPKLIKILILLLIPAGLAAVYIQGYLDPILTSPTLRAGIKSAQEAAQPYLLELAEKFPELGKWISPIPSLDDVSPEEYEGLKMAASAKPEAGGYKLALAQSQADSLAPVFYVTSNLPDGAVIDVYVDGIPDTLLNQLSFTTRVQATLTKRLGKTPVVRFSDGKPLPRGQYMVYATESDKQPPAVKTLLGGIAPVTARTPAVLPRGLKLLASKAYFLGGPKDTIYAARLKEFHDKLLAKAQGELAEVKQFATTLESQFAATATQFAKLRKGKKITPAQKRAWGDFSKQWGNLDAQMNQSFQKWTPAALQSEYFYGVLYQLVLQAGQAIDQVHGFHNSYFGGSADPKSFDIQLGTAMSLAQNSIAALKAKIDQAIKLVPTPNGMPRRDGL